MYSRHSALVMFLALAWASSALAGIAYNSPIASYGSPASVVALPQLGEAQAEANSDAAGARAAAAKINQLNRKQLDIYGRTIGLPLLARPYGAVTNLYAAALPPRSFVGSIEPGFYKDSYGDIKFQGESTIGVVVA